MATTEQKLRNLEHEVAGVLNRLAQDDPSWARFLSRMPAYRYFYKKGSHNRWFWTTETVKHNGKNRYASGVYKYLKSTKKWKLTQARYHAKRKDAKDRALRLFKEGRC